MNENKHCPDCGLFTLELIENTEPAGGEYKECRTCPQCDNMVYIVRYEAVYPYRLDYWGVRGTAFAIRRISPSHVRAEVTTAKGNVYALTYAASLKEQEPTRDQIMQVWRETRYEFRAFNQSEGCYVQ